MNRQKMLFFCSLLLGLQMNAGTIKIKDFQYAGPFALQRPFCIDSVNVNGKTFDAKELLDTPMTLDLIDKPEAGTNGSKSAKGAPASNARSQETLLKLAGFHVENTVYTNAKLLVTGPEDYHLYVDGKKTEAAGKDSIPVTFEPGSHTIVLKYLDKGDNRKPEISVTTEKDHILTVTDNRTKRLYTLKDVLNGTRFTGVEISPDGKYLITDYKTTQDGGKTTTCVRITELATGKIVAERTEDLHWMPHTCRYYYTRDGVNGRQLVTVNPANGSETVLADRLPDGSFSVSPTEDYLLFYTTQKGPQERKDIFEVVDPDDRQPGWRDRTSLAKYDLKTGLMQPLTYGFHNITASDISQDGRYLLLIESKRRLTSRPTTLNTLYRLDLRTMQADTLVKDDGFISNAWFSPDGKQVLIAGSPECLGGIGKNVQPGQIPSMIDTQLYLMDLATKKVKPLTKDFNPNVQQAVWNTADDQIWFTAENRDYYSLYRLDPASGSIRQVKVPEDLVLSFSLAGHSPMAAWYGESASNAHRLYTLNTRSLKSVLKEDLSAGILKGIALGECKEWNFTNSRGDTIYGRYYLPPHFDPDKKYPMIVNYYGGCSPTSRNFESRYPQHAYAALGYVVYIIEPSGATGFGQEFSARHVNTYGDYTADDIIEGTKKFTETHPFVNAKKIGCIGASYGGFMTQYLQTKTDIFAAAISHAGISDIAGYWGYGYWGYSYSEVSAAGSYPWNNKELYVDHSPLYNADKIHTPILFLHGTTDMNVPTAQGISMYTALKLLGRPAALVEVEGQGHHITDYDKRVRWQNTIWAWFARYLQDDPTWWNALYPPKNL